MTRSRGGIGYAITVDHARNWGSVLLSVVILATCTAGTSGGKVGLSGQAALAVEDEPPVTVLLQGRLEPHLGLDPVLEIDPSTRPVAAASERHRIRGWDDDGILLFEVPLETASVADAQSETSVDFFATASFAGPPSRLARVQLTTSDERVLERVAVLTRAAFTDALHTTANFTARRGSEGQVQISWDGEVFPVLIVRDANTGSVLATGREGQTTVMTTADRLRITVSEGVRSGTILLQVS